MKRFLIIISFFVLATQVQSHGVRSDSHHTLLDPKSIQYVLTDPLLLQALDIKPLLVRYDLGVALAEVNAEQERQMSIQAHEWGRCGGYETLMPGEFVPTVGSVQLGAREYRQLTNIFSGLEKRRLKDQVGLFVTASPRLEFDPSIKMMVDQVESENIRNWVEWFSSYPTRHHAASTANDHVFAMKTRLEQMLAGSHLPVVVETIDHQRTNQKSLRARIVGSKRPQEIVVMGGHFDSINQSWSDRRAPGADDNASGSSSVVEALRILANGPAPERTIEFMWYAAEEVGLWGSAEIAAQYKSAGKDVIGVLQLDMTMHPGDGELTIASMSDFTSRWLRELLLEMNKHYLGLRILDDKCGYGCSDHASWHRQGFATLMPFESTMNTMNRNIHTANDVINSQSNFRHAAAFSKIAVSFALVLGNSTLRE